MAMYRQRCLHPLVIVAGQIVIVHLQVANARVEPEIAVGDLALSRGRGRHFPSIRDVPQHRKTAAVFVDRVVILLRDGRVGQRVGRSRVVVAQVEHRRARVRPQRMLAIAADELPLVVGVVDIAAFLAIVAHRTDREAIVDRYVDVRLERAADPAFAELVDFAVRAEFEGADLRLGGDEAQHACERACTEQGALRTGNRFEPLHVVDLDIRDFLAGDRDFVEVVADRGIGTARWHDAAEIDFIAARANARERDRRKQSCVILQPLDLALRKEIRRKRLDRDRHFLDVFRLAGGSDDDFVKPAGGLGLVGRSGLRSKGFLRERGLRRGDAGEYGGKAQRPQRVRPATGFFCHSVGSLGYSGR